MKNTFISEKLKFKNMQLIFFLLFLNVSLFSQAEFELFGGKSLIYHNSDFQMVNNLPNCCIIFKSGSGQGDNIGIGISVNIYKDEFLKFSIISHNSQIIFKETQKDVFNLNGKDINGLYSHNAEFVYKSNSINLAYIYKLNPKFNLLLGIYSDLIYEVKFKQYEKIEEPSNQAVFVDTQTRIRNSYEISLNNNMKFGISPGIEVKFPLNKKENLYIGTIIQFKIDFNNSFKEVQSTENSFNAYLKLVYKF